MKRFEELLRDAQAAFSRFFVSDYFPCLSFVDKLAGSMDWLDSIFIELDSFYQELIDEHLDRKRGEKDVVDVLIELREEKCSTIDLDWDHIKAMLMNIFIAGTDTTAATIVWTMVFLIKAPNMIMKKLQQEIRSVVGES